MRRIMFDASSRHHIFCHTKIAQLHLLKNVCPTFALRELTSTYWSNAFSDLIGADRGRWGLLEAEIYQRFAQKGYTGELLEHKSELLPSWYREAVEAKISSFSSFSSL